MAPPPRTVPQAAAIPVLDGKLCLVPSSSGRRGVLPKGCVDPGQTAAETALQESWEEAGLLGRVGAEPVGTYAYEKYGGVCQVAVYLMEVAGVASDWPERGLRRRAWMSLSQALRRIEEKELREVI